MRIPRDVAVVVTVVIMWLFFLPRNKRPTDPRGKCPGAFLALQDELSKFFYSPSESIGVSRVLRELGKTLGRLKLILFDGSS